MLILSNDQKIYIGHILTKSIDETDAWSMNKNEHQELLNRFGNVTLLGQEYNCKAKNQGFKQKKKLYELSEILMTKELINYSIWTRKEIETRQEQLAKIALEVRNKN